MGNDELYTIDIVFFFDFCYCNGIPYYAKNDHIIFQGLSNAKGIVRSEHDKIQGVRSV